MTPARPLRIAVIGHALRSAGGLSVGKNLTAAIAKAAPEDEILFVVPEGAGYEAGLAGHPRARALPLPPMGAAKRVLSDAVEVPRVVRGFAPDVVLALDSSHAMLRPPCPQLVLLHAPQLVYPSRFYGPRTLANRARHAFLERRFRRALPRTAAVLCQTQVMADRLRGRFGYQGPTPVVGTSFPPALARPRASLAAPPEYARHAASFKLLYVARYYPHKNFEGIVDLFAKHRRELEGVVLFITITSDQHAKAPAVLDRIRQLALEDSIVNLGFVPQEDLARCYAHADAFFQPTLLESFSTTYLEAMAARLPILTSDLDFAREACGDAAEYFDPWNAASMCAAILRIRDDAKAREALVEAASRRAHTLSGWDDVAARVLAEVRRVSAEGQR